MGLTNPFGDNPECHRLTGGMPPAGRPASRRPLHTPLCGPLTPRSSGGRGLVVFFLYLSYKPGAEMTAVSPLNPEAPSRARTFWQSQTPSQVARDETYRGPNRIKLRIPKLRR